MLAETVHLVARARAKQAQYDTQLYGYVPSVSYSAVFITIFGLSTLLHLGQMIYARRYWWMVCMAIGGILEILGWAARLWSHFAPLNFSAFVMQICCLIIAPTFYSASLYWAGGLMIAHVAPESSWLSGTAFKIVFIIADVVSLVIQAIGGGMAGSAVGTTHHQQYLNGSHIMLAGIVVQLAVMVFFVVYLAVWAYRGRDRFAIAGRRLHIMLLGIFLASLGIIVRGCYRTPELSEGFSGWIATQQPWQLFDAIPVAFSTYVLNIIHPHWFLRYTREADIQAYDSEKPKYEAAPTTAAEAGAAESSSPSHSHRDSGETAVSTPERSAKAPSAGEPRLGPAPSAEHS
ncbi:hypothetical protein JCM8202_001505 [Rhodotorula sphaerocarpa]